MKKDALPPWDGRCWCGAPGGVCRYPWLCYRNRFAWRDERDGGRLRMGGKALVDPEATRFAPSPRLSDAAPVAIPAERPSDLVTGNDDSSETEAAE